MSSYLLNSSMKNAVEISRSIAREYHHEFFYPAHLLRALVHKEVGLSEFIKSIGHDPGYIFEWAEVRIEEYPKSTQPGNEIKGDNGVKSIMEEADTIRMKLGLDDITPICVFTSMVKPGIGFTTEQLRSFPVKERDILDNYLQQVSVSQAIDEQPVAANVNGALMKYCIDRTALAKQKNAHTIVGRDKERRQLLEILSRSTKPHVMITGEPGVGKTALVDLLASDIIGQRVPAQLSGTVIFELDTGALAAGASYKGEVEERMKNILQGLKTLGKTILFIDGVQTLFDPKNSLGTGVANLLKPELSRGELTVIAATTTDDFRKLIEPDDSFCRRFEVLTVVEPGTVTATKIVDNIVPALELHHLLTVHQGVSEAAVLLAKRYIKDRHLPDSAIDLVDRTMASVKLVIDTSHDDLTNFELHLDQLDAANTIDETRKEEYQWVYQQLLERISPVLLSKIEELSTATAGMPVEHTSGSIRHMIQQLKTLAGELEPVVTPNDIAAMIASKTGIPIGKIQAQEKDKLLNMPEELRKKVIGQDHAIDSVCGAIMESRSGLNKKGQPIGSFFFLGPTGTGKTELARSLAGLLFNNEKAMIRFDMSEFKEEHSAALLYGAPPGYVGYEEGGMLVNKIRQQPYAVLLFDEIEKAHPSVFDTFLQILDEGHMHDRLGKEGDFSNALIIFTSNIASDVISANFRNGIIPKQSELVEKMTAYFRPEFLARLTEIIPFSPITEASLIRIFSIQLKSLLSSLNEQKVTLTITPEAVSFLAHLNFTEAQGARQIATVIRNQLRRPLSKMLITGELNQGDHITVECNNNELTWNIR